MKFSEQLIVLFKGFAKAKSDINYSVVDAHIVKARQFLAEKSNYVLGNVRISGVELHRAGITLHVHDNVRTAMGCSDVEYFRVEVTATDVIDPMCSSKQCFVSDISSEGIDRNKASWEVIKYLSDGGNNLF